MTRAYFKGAVGALVVFDSGDSHTYSAARKWKADIDKKCALPDGRKIPAILIANKVSSVLRKRWPSTGRKGVVNKPQNLAVLQGCPSAEIVGLG